MPKKILLIVPFLLLLSPLAMSQSQTIQALGGKYKNVRTMFFYKNTLQMLNQMDSKEFDELIEDIDKIKFMSFSKTENNFLLSDFKNLIKSYKSESFEQLMSMQQKGHKFDVYIKESKDVTQGLAIIINETEQLSIIDIKGSVAIEKIAALVQLVSQVK